MRRWFLTAALSTAAAAAFWAPSLPELQRPRSFWTTGDGPVAFEAKLDEAAFLEGSTSARYLVLTLGAPAEDNDERRPVDLALVVDTSGSMGTGGKIEHAREAAAAVVGSLGPEDRFALVGFSDDARVLLPGAGFDGDRERLLGVVSGLEDHGGTNLFEGFAAGRGQLGDSDRIRRLLVVSDGNATVGITDAPAFHRLVTTYRDEGVTVSALGLGADFNEVLLEGLADAGGGNYAFVQHTSELAAVAAREFDEATRMVASDTEVTVQLPEGVRARAVHGWPYTVAGRTLTVPVGALYAGQTRKIVLELDATVTETGTLRVADAGARYTLVADGSERWASLAVDAVVTADVEVARASRDEEATVAAARARAGSLNASAAQALREGRHEEARSAETASKGVLEDALRGVSAAYAPELRSDLDRQEVIAEMKDSNLKMKASSAVGREMSR